MVVVVWEGGGVVTESVLLPIALFQLCELWRLTNSKTYFTQTFAGPRVHFSIEWNLSQPFFFTFHLFPSFLICPEAQTLSTGEVCK